MKHYMVTIYSLNDYDGPYTELCYLFFETDNQEKLDYMVCDDIDKINEALNTNDISWLEVEKNLKIIDKAVIGTIIIMGQKAVVYDLDEIEVKQI